VPVFAVILFVKSAAALDAEFSNAGSILGLRLTSTAEAMLKPEGLCQLRALVLAQVLCRCVDEKYLAPP